jgi:hypothetical protein
MRERHLGRQRIQRYRRNMTYSYDAAPEKVRIGAGTALKFGFFAALECCCSTSCCPSCWESWPSFSSYPAWSTSTRCCAADFCELLAQSRVDPAYFVVARRGKNASARFSSARRRAIFRRSLLGS